MSYSGRGSKRESCSLLSLLSVLRFPRPVAFVISMSFSEVHGARRNCLNFWEGLCWGKAKFRNLIVTRVSRVVSLVVPPKTPVKQNLRTQKPSRRFHFACPPLREGNAFHPLRLSKISFNLPRQSSPTSNSPGFRPFPPSPRSPRLLASAFQDQASTQ